MAIQSTNSVSIVVPAQEPKNKMSEGKWPENQSIGGVWNYIKQNYFKNPAEADQFYGDFSRRICREELKGDLKDGKSIYQIQLTKTQAEKIERAFLKDMQHSRYASKIKDIIKPEPLPEAKPEAKAEAKPEAKTEAKPEAKTEAKPEAKTEAKPEAKTEAKPEAKTEAKPEAKTEAKPEAKTEAKPEAKAVKSPTSDPTENLAVFNLPISTPKGKDALGMLLKAAGVKIEEYDISDTGGTITIQKKGNKDASSVKALSISGGIKYSDLNDLGMKGIEENFFNLIARNMSATGDNTKDEDKVLTLKELENFWQHAARFKNMSMIKDDLTEVAKMYNKTDITYREISSSEEINIKQEASQYIKNYSASGGITDPHKQIYKALTGKDCSGTPKNFEHFKNLVNSVSGRIGVNLSNLDETGKNRLLAALAFYKVHVTSEEEAGAVYGNGAKSLKRPKDNSLKPDQWWEKALTEGDQPAPLPPLNQPGRAGGPAVDSANKPTSSEFSPILKSLNSTNQGIKKYSEDLKELLGKMKEISDNKKPIFLEEAKNTAQLYGLLKGASSFDDIEKLINKGINELKIPILATGDGNKTLQDLSGSSAGIKIIAKDKNNYDIQGLEDGDVVRLVFPLNGAYMISDSTYKATKSTSKDSTCHAEINGVAGSSKIFIERKANNAVTFYKIDIQDKGKDKTGVLIPLEQPPEPKAENTEAKK